MRFIIAFLFAFALTSHAQNSPAGRWEGSVKIPGRELPLIVDLARDDSGSWIGSIIIPGLDVKGATLSEIALKGPEVSFAIKSALGGQTIGPLKFKGRVSGNRLSGDFTQAGNTAPFALEKTGPAQVEVPPRSTAIAKEFEGEWKGEYEIFGAPRHVTLKLTNHGSQNASAEFVIVGRKTTNLPVDLVTQEGDFVTIDSHETNISYEGRLVKGEINGTLLQGTIELPLVLHRAN